MPKSNTTRSRHVAAVAAAIAVLAMTSASAQTPQLDLDALAREIAPDASTPQPLRHQPGTVLQDEAGDGPPDAPTAQPWRFPQTNAELAAFGRQILPQPPENQQSSICILIHQITQQQHNTCENGGE
jgi:hypothetical protein